MFPNSKRMRTAESSVPRQTNINDLPEVILCLILSLLPLQQQVVASLVCRSWRYLWLQSPDWRLMSSTFPRVKNKRQKFEELVDKVIFFSGRHIRSMKLVHTTYDPSSTRASLWIQHLVGQGIVRLDVNLCNPIPPPLSLFRSETLTELRLGMNNEHIRLPPTVLLPKLRFLSLHRAQFSSAIVFQNLINGCPVLVVLELRQSDITGPEIKEISIPQTTLRVINIDNGYVFRQTKLRVSTANLIEFYCSGINVMGNMHDFESQTSPLVASFDPEEYLFIYHESRRQGFSTTYGIKMSSMLASFHNTKHLFLNDWSIEYLTNIPTPIKFPPFRRLESLTVSMWPNSGHIHVIALSVLFSPVLNRLRVTIPEAFVDRIYGGDRSDYPVPDSGFMEREMVHYHLKNVEIIKKSGVLTDELVLIKFLLKVAVGLHELVAKCQGDPAARKTVRNLIKSYPRRSENVKLSVN
ncbi:hypothetical protein Cni_G23890 [Canna indica]|uniref:F-box domain-containing protein n=1 Tax=Canna indica TaxID=4628 RepID=A0AAQ3KUV3_9LILI|nr:hypothetical protein Cni_G23890 [Canna indica]